VPVERQTYSIRSGTQTVPDEVERDSRPSCDKRLSDPPRGICGLSRAALRVVYRLASPGDATGSEGVAVGVATVVVSIVVIVPAVFFGAWLGRKFKARR